MVKRTLSKQRMIFAAVITAMIFFLGLALGVIIDLERLSTLQEDNTAQELNYNSLQLQYLYLNQLGEEENVCPVLQVALDNSIKELSTSLEAFERYSENTFLSNKRYQTLQRKYLQDNLRYWMFSQQLQQRCDSDVVNILYFYSEDDCAVCANQGTVLTYFKQKLDDKLLVFPINIDLAEEEQFLKIITTRYNITQLPTLVINEDIYSGVQGRVQLAEIICEKTSNRETCLL